MRNTWAAPACSRDRSPRLPVATVAVFPSLKTSACVVPFVWSRKAKVFAPVAWMSDGALSACVRVLALAAWSMWTS